MVRASKREWSSDATVHVTLAAIPHFPVFPNPDFRTHTQSFDQVESVTGTLSNFILEPFLPHPSDAEYYVCITSQREGDTILFTHEGGVDIGDVDAKALKLDIHVDKPFPSRDEFKSTLLKHVPSEKQATLVDFLIRLYCVYVDLHFAYLEINPLVCLDGVNGGQPKIHYLDMAAKLDQTADSICGPKWAIARDLTIYEGSHSVTPSKSVSADRGPPMVGFYLALDMKMSSDNVISGLAGAVRS